MSIVIKSGGKEKKITQEVSLTEEDWGMIKEALDTYELAIKRGYRSMFNEVKKRLTVIRNELPPIVFKRKKW